MTEAEYMTVAGLARVRCMQNVLFDVKGTPGVPLGEYRQVLQVLTKWERELAKRVTIT